MYFDALIGPTNLSAAGAWAVQAESLGFSALWTQETAHDPFLPLVPAALTTLKIGLGTSIAVAFPRSPTVTAHLSWDLAQASEGRFMLGLGTQVKAHIERRFGMEWSAPAERLRDYIGAVRAVWHTWQTGERLRYTGTHYNLKLMTPFFSPEPLASGYPPPIFIAGVNRQLCMLAGETCEGFQAHPFHTRRYLENAVMPAIGEGLQKAGRGRSSIQVSSAIFVITGEGSARDTLREEVRKQIAFYASTPTYRTVLAEHGWESTGEELTRLASRGAWDRMPNLITDEILGEVTIEAPTLKAAALQAQVRYAGLLDRASFYLPFVPGERDEDWRRAISVF